MATRKITIFSDFTDPASYLAERAVRDVGAPHEVDYRAFERYPSPAALPTRADLDHRITGLAARREFKNAPDFVPRTRKAHELAKLASAAGTNLRPAIYDAYWTEGRDISRIDVLVDIASRGGLEAQSTRILLDIDEYAERVEEDVNLARRLKIAGVPVIYVGTGRDAIILAGVVTAQALDDALRRS